MLALLASAVALAAPVEVVPAGPTFRLGLPPAAGPRAVVGLAFGMDGSPASLGLAALVAREGAAGRWLNAAEPGPVGRLAWSPDGGRLAAGGADGLVRLWDGRTGDLLQTLAGTGAPIDLLAFRPDGHRLLVGDRAGVLARWDVRTGKRLFHLPLGPIPLGEAVLAPDGDLLAVARGDALRLLSLTTGEEVAALGGAGGPLAAPAFSPDGKFVAAAVLGPEGGSRWWRLDSGRELAPGPACDGPVAWCRMPPGRDAALVTFDRAGDNHRVSLRAVDPRGVPFGVAQERVVEVEPRRAAFATGGGLVAVPEARRAAVVLVECAQKPTRRQCLAGPEDEAAPPDWCRALAFSADGAYLFGLERDGTVRLWETATGGEVLRRSGPAAATGPLLPSPDGRLLAVAVGREVVVWDVTGRGSTRVEAPWADLLGPDAARAYAAAAVLADDPDAVAKIRRELDGTAEERASRKARVASALNPFAAPGLTADEVAAGGLPYEAPLLALLAEPGIAKQPVQALLDRVKPRAVVQAGRVVRVLERAGSPEARRLLRDLAETRPAGSLVDEARASLSRR